MVGAPGGARTAPDPLRDHDPARGQQLLQALPGRDRGVGGRERARRAGIATVDRERAERADVAFGRVDRLPVRQESPRVVALIVDDERAGDAVNAGGDDAVGQRRK